MAVFNYKVVDRDGKNKKGTIEAPNRDGAEKKLKSEGYSIMSLTEQSSPLGGIGFMFPCMCLEKERTERICA